MAKTKKCPVCGTSIKIENLEKHIKKVHPQEKVDLEYSEKDKDELKRVSERKKKFAKTSSKKIYAGLAIIVAIITVASLLLYLPSEENEVKSPKIQVTYTSHDFGIVENPSTLSYDFTIENVGTGILEINKIETSCVCTSTTLEVNGEVSGPFTSSPSNWKQQIEPGKSAILTIDWDTLYFTTPQEGLGARTVKIYTNDPANSVVTFEVKANIIRT